MKSPQSEDTPSPRAHSANIQRELSQLIDHLEADRRRVNHARFRGLLGKSVEVLTGLRSLFERFDSTGAETRQRETAPSARLVRSRDERKGAASTKDGAGKKKPAPRSEKSRATPRANEKKETATLPRTDKRGDSPKKSASPDTPSNSAVPGRPAPGNGTPHQPDPLEVAAKAEQQRREARAPKTPGGHAAPRPMPPRSGKPVWSKPHSS